MKTQNIIAALVLTIATVSVSLASSPCRVLTFKDSFGRNFTMPVKEEVAEDTVPIEIAREFQKARMEEVNRVFDLSSITKPEQDVNDNDIDLKEIFDSLKNERE